MKPLLSIFAIFSLALGALVYQSGGPPDYAAITAAADAAFDGTVEKIALAKNENQMTKVVLRITKVTKGDLKTGDLVAVYHEPGELASDDHKGIARGYRCPPYAAFSEGLSYSVWATWDAKKKRYEVPGAAWAKVKDN